MLTISNYSLGGLAIVDDAVAVNPSDGSGTQLYHIGTAQEPSWAQESAPEPMSLEVKIAIGLGIAGAAGLLYVLFVKP